MYNVSVFLFLFIIATAVAIVVRRFAMPYTVALVLAGLFLGFFHIFQAPHLTKTLLFTVFLPGLLFEAAFHINFHQFWRNRLTIVTLAVPGVLAAMALTTLILAPVASLLGHSSFTWRQALVFGALIAATDPIAVIAIFKEMGGPRRLRIIMEGESLLNDGTGIVFFILSVSLLTGTEVSIVGLVGDFFSIVGIGLAIGTVVGFVVSQVIKRVDDAMIEISLTTLAAYGSFMAAEQFHYSGVIATVAAGMVCGNYGARFGMSPSSRIAIESFWDYVAFALNSIVFLLIGFEVRIESLIAAWRLILVAYLAVTVGRVVVVFLSSALMRRTRERIPWSWSAVLTWGGLRGALSMVLVLSLPASFPERRLLVTVTFGVVIIWILIHGLTIFPLLRWLGIIRGQEERQAVELMRGKLMAAYAGLETLDRMGRGRFRNSSLIQDFRQEYEQTIQKLEQEIGQIELDPEQLHEEEKRWARRHLLIAEKKQVLDDFHEGRLSQQVYEKLMADIDARLLEMETIA
jgi:monovalent cation:H+ antiporter, CPA1 family